MKIIDEIKKDAEEKNISIPLVEEDCVFTTGSELNETLQLQKTQNAQETISSVDALYFVLKEQYGEEFAGRVLKRVYDRAQPFVFKNGAVGLLGNANKKVVHDENIELLTMLNRKMQAVGFVPPDKAPLTKFKINTNSNKYKGTKCCYVPKMCLSSLAGRERGKYIEIDLIPAPANELNDFLSELASVNQENHSKMSEDEYNLKQAQIAMLGSMLTKYHELKNVQDGGRAEIKIYEILASLMRTEILPKPKRIFIKKPNYDEDYEPATKIQDIDAIKEIEDHSNKVLRVFFEKGQNPTILPNFAGNYVDILGHTGFTEEEITNERQ